jgi:cell division protein FtsZ
MGTGEAEGEDRAAKAADMAISNPLLDDVTMKGAKGVLINITGGPDLMLFEVEQAANRIRAEVDPDANIIFGNTILDEMEGRIRVSVVATGIDAEQMALPEKKVTTLRTPFKPQPVRAAAPAPQPAPAPVAVPSPVHAQVEALAAELGAPAQAPSHAEDYILGGAETPEAPAEMIPAPAAARYAATETVRSPAEMPLAQRPVEHKKGGWGLFGRRKAVPAPDMRAEPAPAYPKPQPSRGANVQPMEKPATAATASDDLFPEQNGDEQFEIPAFLRRQSGQ